MGEAAASAAAADGPVLEWSLGLPSGSDLTPLSQILVPSPLASAFSVPPDPPRTPLDVHRASHETLSALRRHNSTTSSSFPPFSSADPVLIADSTDIDPDPPSRKSGRPEDPADADDAARALKRPRVVWTPELHKRFVAVVTHLGVKNAVPKTIMSLMNVDGLTRGNVASHLQKYRLYLKRMQQNEAPSSSDHIFASAPVPHSLHEPPPKPYAPPSMIPMPVFSMRGSAGMVMLNNHQGSRGAYRGFEMLHSYRPFGGRLNGWSGRGSNYGSMVSYPPVSHIDK